MGTTRFNGPTEVVVDGEGTIVVSDIANKVLHKIVNGQVTTLTDRSEPGTTDGTGAVAYFHWSLTLDLDEGPRVDACWSQRLTGRTRCGW